MADPVEVLDFWLGEVGPAGWYAGGDALDATCRERFADIWQAARDGGLDHWVDGAVGTLAYLVICDQLPRNMFRGHADQFATDGRALAAARTAIDNGWDLDAPEPERQFFYMPFMHSEVLADQEHGLHLFADRMPDTGADQRIHALAHREVIARYGRFPTRNAALGRENTAGEVAYLADGGYGAIVTAIRASHAASA